MDRSPLGAPDASMADGSEAEQLTSSSEIQKLLQKRHLSSTQQQTSLGIQDLTVLTVQLIWKEIISLATPPKLALLASVIGLFSVS